jgi:hypothetical protein
VGAGFLSPPRAGIRNPTYDLMGAVNSIGSSGSNGANERICLTARYLDYYIH